ncbi:unnamed protein product [Brachionus calyciflorus]|uniref:Uncharacterized protein n=1 Tax=Brachionus calyciflorus TaxID=104777 RepID=A0A813ZMR9_9BILA|nr:unnamed protein product [Brachionus calyciflorus]
MSGYGSLLRSLSKSTDKPVRAIVKGEIPKWVNGSLYRNGPGRFEFGNNRYEHLFDGQACVHKFTVQNGEVFYSNKLLETKSYQKTIENNKLFPNFGTTDKGSNIYKRFKNFFFPPETSDNVNVNILPYAQDHLYALTETHLMCKLDPKNLSINHTVNIKEHVGSIKSTIAHPHIERDGTWITMGVNPRGENGGAHYEFVRFKGGDSGRKSKHICEQAQVIASIPSSNKNGFSYFHSFAVTENYIVFLEQCLQIDFKSLIESLIKNKPRSSALISYKDMPTRIHLINKHNGNILKKKFVTDPQFTFHYINAYEKDDQILLDLSSYDSKYFNVENFSYENMKSGKLMETNMLKALARRVRIPLTKPENEKGEVYCEIKDINSDLPFELPVINYWKNNGLFYKYVYGTNHYKNPFSIIKMNVEDPREVYEFKYGQDGFHALPSEPIFVETHHPKSEDDGVLLVMVLCEKNDYLSVLDAKNLNEIARADIPEEVRGAFTFHGFFADQKNFQNIV